jgi:transposase-like protein
MIRISLEAEIRSFIERHKDMTLDDGRPAIVRNGYNPERAFTVSSGTVTVKVPRSRDRSGTGLTFSSTIVPRYMRRSLSLEEAIPLLHLMGISGNDMVEGGGNTTGFPGQRVVSHEYHPHKISLETGV